MLMAWTTDVVIIKLNTCSNGLLLLDYAPTTKGS